MDKANTKEALKGISFLLGISSESLMVTVSDILRQAGCVSVVPTESGDKTLTTLKRGFRTREYFVVLDMDLVKISGMEVAREIRGDANLENLPILILSSDLTPEQISMAAEIGVNGFIVKPFTPSAFVEKALAIIEARKNPPEHIKLIMQGEELFKSQKYEEALAQFNLSKKLNKSARIFVNIGEVHEVKKDYNHATESYKEAVKINPKYIKAYNAAANMFLKLKKSSTALAFLNKAAEISPNNPDRMMQIAKLHLENGDTEKADAAFQKAIKLNPHKSIEVSETLIASEKAEKAEEYLRKYLERDENHIATYNKLGIALRRQGRWQKAVEEYRKALAIYKDDEGLYFNMGKAFLEGKSYDRARDCFYKALELKPQFPEALAELKKLS
ncbi:MAG: tetratricopeptide repeat protein [Nitrospinota bacterium]|nr:tetratricopeptide repeat protein [Nitrospinota bacterium]